MLESGSYPQPLITAADSSVSTSMPKRTRRIAILGFGATVKDCPWRADTGWELWAMNGFWRAAKPDFEIEAPEDRYALWFDMHTAEYTKEYGKRAGFGDAQHEWLKKEHPFPVFMLDADPGYPSVVPFPIHDVIQATGRDYFTSTVAYALAWALVQPDVAEIGMWGIDLVHATEYVQQRPCAEYWIGRAEAMGIKVTSHEDSALLKARTRYGYDQEGPLLKDLRALLVGQAQGLIKAIEKNTSELERLRGQAHTDDGALQTVRGVLERLDIYERGGKV